MASVTDERHIRFSLGAVGPNEALVTTAEMDTALELYPDWRLAAAFIADSLAARAISDPSSFSIPSEMSVSWPDRSKSWRETAKTLRKEVQAEQLAEGPVGL